MSLRVCVRVCNIQLTPVNSQERSHLSATTNVARAPARCSERASADREQIGGKFKCHSVRRAEGLEEGTGPPAQRHPS